MTTIRNTARPDTEMDRGRGAADAPPRSRRPYTIALLAVFALLALAAGGWDITHAAWYQEWRLSKLSLAHLQRERGGRLDDPRLLYYVGLRLNQQGRYAEADPYLRNAVGLDPDAPRLRDAWMQALLGSGLTTAAFGEAREFAGTHPDSASAHLILGKFYVSQDSMIRATQELTRAVILDPSLSEGWSLLAVAQTGLDHITEAEAAARRAVALRPQSAPDRLGLALLLTRQGRRKEAIDCFGAAIALGPTAAVAHEEYARYLLTTSLGESDTRRAETEARRALGLDPGNPLALETQGQALAALGQVREALPLLLQAAQISPRAPDFALVLSQIYDRLGQADLQQTWQSEYQRRQHRAQAEQDLVTAILKSPDDPQPQRRLARMLAEEGDVGGCLRHQAKALRCAPDAPPAQAAAAEDLVVTGHAAAALPLAQRAVKIAPKSPAAYEALGDVQLALGQPSEAVHSYSKSAREDPQQIRRFQARLDQYDRNTQRK
jgi:tetratricopeptide (TPR) repeat protein